MSDQHYFSAEPSTPERRRTVRVTLAGREVEVLTANGIFSPDGVDKGTAVLLDEAPLPPAQGTFLDIGCGWGPLTLTLGLGSPDAAVWAVDVNERSLALTRENAQHLGADNVTATTPDEVPEDLTFDLIWSNPPIRVGKEVLHQILQQWLPRLNVGGEAYLVVQKNLGSDSLQSWIGTTFAGTHTVERYARSKAFRVLLVRRTA